MKSFIVIIFILSLSSCRNNNYTPAEPDSVTIEDNLEHFVSPKKADIFYVGETVPIEYEYFKGPDRVTIQIIKKTSVRYTIAEEAVNTGHFEWETNTDTRTSVHYQVKISDAYNPEIYIISDSFGLIPK